MDTPPIPPHLSYLLNSPAGSGQAARKASIPNSWALGNPVPVPSSKAKISRPPPLASYLFWYILRRVSGAAAVAPCFKTHPPSPSDLLSQKWQRSTFRKVFRGEFQLPEGYVDQKRNY
ncbi:hypothetical protein H0G86_001689 [Trichoderma simmonsii]|uniref:Uncharacterized protein n=1 Tax=Trichoderma simmonsii TaxID=1491479 RepID=A0A8G0L6R3_9HYPO|nr:hypothetical protein H0G86_001689 [Trichoderma simmonsii]